MGGFVAVAEHEDGFVCDVDAVAAEHGANFRVERGEGFKDEGIGDGAAFGLGWCGLGGTRWHVGRMAQGLERCKGFAVGCKFRLRGYALARGSVTQLTLLKTLTSQEQR